MSEAPGLASVAPVRERSTASVPGEVGNPPKVSPDIRTVLRKRFKSKKFQIVIICLVIVDALLVAFHLMFDLKVIHLDSHLFKVFHYLSIAIPVFFLVEIVLKLYAFRMEFFYRKLEILDAAIVIISFVMDFSLLLQKHKLEGFSFLILLRLWRVASIISGILLSVKIRYEKQVLKMERINLELSRKIQQLESSYSEKEQEIERLEKLLRRNGVLE